MSERVAALLAEALTLSAALREELADATWDSLDLPPSEYDGMTEEEFKAELDRRHAEFERDPSVGIPLEEVMQRTRLENDPPNRPKS
jgi:putative addiction module component (TIGR02574 family)